MYAILTLIGKRLYNINGSLCTTYFGSPRAASHDILLRHQEKRTSGDSKSVDVSAGANSVNKTGTNVNGKLSPPPHKCPALVRRPERRPFASKMSHQWWTCRGWWLRDGGTGRGVVWVAHAHNFTWHPQLGNLL